MDSSLLLARYAEVSGLIDRLETLASWVRVAYDAEDKGQFHRFMAEYGHSWRVVQNAVTEFGRSALSGALDGNFDLGPPSSMHDELTGRLVNHTNSMHAFMAGVNRENPQFLRSETSTTAPKTRTVVAAPSRYDVTPRKQSACYIATAVYGSYDAPPVKILRRFRDERLAVSVGGRAFIRFYYAVGPTIAGHFGKDAVLSRIGRVVLDFFVRRLETRDG